MRCSSIKVNGAVVPAITVCSLKLIPKILVEENSSQILITDIEGLAAILGTIPENVPSAPNTNGEYVLKVNNGDTSWIEPATPGLPSEVTISGTHIQTAYGGNHTTIDTDGITTNGLALDNYSFPSADGNANEILATNGSGVISWTNFNIPTIANTDTILIGDNAGNATSSSYTFPLDASDSAQIINTITVPSTTNFLSGDGSGAILDSGVAISSIPTSTNDLTNNSGFITASDIPAIPTIQVTDTILIGDNSGNAFGSYTFPLDASDSAQIINAANYDQTLNTTDSVVFADVQTKTGKYVTYTDSNTVTSGGIPIFGDATGQPLTDSGYVFPLDASDPDQVINAGGIVVPSTGNFLAGDGSGGIIDSGVSGIPAIPTIGSTQNILVGDGGGNASDSGYGFPLDPSAINWPINSYPVSLSLTNYTGNTWSYSLQAGEYPINDYLFSIDGDRILKTTNTTGFLCSGHHLGAMTISLSARFGIFISPAIESPVDTMENLYDPPTGGYNWSTTDNDPSVGGCFVSDGSNPQNFTFNINDLLAGDRSAFLLSFVGNDTDHNNCDRIILDNGVDHFEIGIFSVLDNGDGTILVNTWLPQAFVISGPYTISRRAY